MYSLVKQVNSEKEWLSKLQQIKLLKPESPLTRPNLAKGTRFNRLPDNYFNFSIEYQEEPVLEEEEDLKLQE